MNKMNFRNLENLQVPDELMEKLLAIPETAEDKPAGIPWWRSRYVVAAASLVLVSALSLLLYLNFGVKPPVEVKPSAPATEIVWSTDENGETIATEIVVVPDSTTGQDGTQPTEPKSGIQQLIEQIFGTENPSPTTAPDSGSDRGRTNPTTKPNPIDGDRTNPTTKPGSNEGGKTDPPTKPDPLNPPALPTQPPDDPEPVEPTEPPDDPEPVETTEPPDDPPDPTEPPDVEPVEPTEPPYTDTISDLVYIGEIPDGSVIYCWLYDDNTHRRMYEYDAYTTMFYAEVTPLGDGYASLSYTPKAHGVDLPYKGHYQYLWYLSFDGGYTGRRLYLGDINLNN